MIHGYSKILIVDDDPDASGELERILVAKGFKVSVADSVKQAVVIVKDLPDIKVVVSEIEIADGNVLDILRYLSGDSHSSPIPLLLCSSSENEEQILKYVKAGAQDYITKPVSPNAIAVKIQKLIDRQRINVLIVDDDKLMRMFMTKSVEREGFNTITAVNGKEALELLESNDNIKLVISDIIMPELDGFGLLAKIKEKYSEIPVLLISGLRGKYTEEDIIAAGAQGYIAKPFKNVEIVNTLKSFNLQSS